MMLRLACSTMLRLACSVESLAHCEEFPGHSVECLASRASRTEMANVEKTQNVGEILLGCPPYLASCNPEAALRALPAQLKLPSGPQTP